jgi:hypothetical protein
VRVLYAKASPLGLIVPPGSPASWKDIASIHKHLEPPGLLYQREDIKWLFFNRDTLVVSIRKFIWSDFTYNSVSFIDSSIS